MRRAQWIVTALSTAAIAALLVARGGRRDDVQPGETTTVPGARSSPIPPAEALATLAAAPTPSKAAARASADARDPDEPPSATRVEGVVRTRDGQPVPGAEVRLEAARPGSTPIVRSARTREDGGFRMNDPPFGPARAFVRGGGWISVGLPDAESLREYDPLRIVVERGVASRIDLVVVPAARAMGRVTGPDGAPVAGAVVDALVDRTRSGGALGPLLDTFDTAPHSPVATTATESDGTFTVDGLVGGASYRFESSARTLLLPAAVGPFRASVEAPIDVQLVLRRGRWIDVRVLGEDDRPIPGARIFATPNIADATQSLSVVLARFRRIASEERITTDARGGVRLGPLENAPVEVRVSAEGFLDDFKQRPPADANALGAPGAAESNGPRVVPVGTDTLTVRLSRGLSISGRVVDDVGRPVSGVSVQAQRRVVRPDGWSLKGFELAWTDADGRFRLPGMPAGRLTIVAKTWTPLRASEREVESGAQDVVLTLGAESASGVVLVILDPDGRPVPKATVNVSAFVPKEVVGGRIELDVDEPFGESEIEIVDPRDDAGHALPYAPKWVTWARGHSRTLEARLEREAPIAGRVLDPTGAGVEGVLLAAKPATPDEANDLIRHLRRGPIREATARTDATGRFRIGGLAPGSYQLTVRVPDAYLAPSPRLVKAGDAPVDIQLRVGVRPTFHVVDAKGVPVVDAVVRVSASDADAASAVAAELESAIRGDPIRTDRDGAVRLEPLDPNAAYEISVRPPVDRPDLRALALPRWKPQDATVRLAEGGWIRGTVRDGDGHAVAHAIVQITMPSGEQKSTYADDNGVFTAVELPVGRVRLVANLGGGATVGHFVPMGPEVTATVGDHDVVLTADRGESLVVRIENPPELQGGLDVLLVPEGADSSRFAHAGRFENGEARFVGLRSDRRYALWIAPTDAEPDLSLWQPGVRGDAGQITVRRVAGRTVRGRMLLPEGSSEVTVTASRGLAEHWVEPGPDGRFELRGLPTGTWKIDCVARHDGENLSGETTVTGSEEVEIRLSRTTPSPR